MAEGGGLGGGAQGEEGLALEGHRGVEVGLGGAAEAGERPERRGFAAGGLPHRLLGLVPEAGVGGERGRGRGAGAGSGRQVGGEGDGAGAEVARRSTRSIRPSSSAFGALTGLPVVAMSTAAAGGHEARQADGAAGARGRCRG